MAVDKINLREVKWEDWKLLLDWRNDYYTRIQSHNTDVVNEEKHKAWLSKVLNDPNKKVFVGILGDESIGTVRYEFKDGEYELSWTIAPEARGRGLGKKLVKKMVDTLKNNYIKAEVKKGNKPSVKIAEYAGLSLVKEFNDILIFKNY